MAIILSSFDQGNAIARQVRLTTLEWPPYVIADGSGPSTEMVTSVFQRAGLEIHTQVFPWNRALLLAASSPEWTGLYPEYYAVGEDAEAGGKRCIYSDPFGTSPVGLLQRKDDPITFRSHADLRAYVISVVRGYQNEARLDDMISAGEIYVELSENDVQTIKMVAGRRVQAGVIDTNVFAYLAERDPAIAAVSGDLEFHPRLLVTQNLHVCFQNSAEGRAARDAFNAALSHVSAGTGAGAATGMGPN
ncbi:ABC transporter [Roseibium aquae]|uniref:ABC transporter n=1 Tax=Roseibium aquae TaxID=1323746 RepID=A0A916TNA6_9HYPH|nr:ABC transporter [Roseibium aquae]